jgi:hypothetical protein
VKSGVIQHTKYGRGVARITHGGYRQGIENIGFFEIAKLQFEMLREVDKSLNLATLCYMSIILFVH